MAEATLVDYYAILCIPPEADLMGVENAYARLSSELAARASVDDTATGALALLNEAYGVLSKPGLRAEYDSKVFAARIDQERRAAAGQRRRRKLAGNMVAGVVAVLILVEGAGLIYLAVG